ncbi:MAG: hypothetical protein EOM18_05475 [Clostridia bacterium]|nr:hypothetical protein [Clostridia bacterium]
MSLENLSKNEQKELLGLYQQELAELTYQQIHALGSGSLTFLDQGKDYLENDYPLNENFTQTVDFLRQMGYDVIFDMEDITDIQSITIYDYRENNDADVDGTEATMTDPELIKEARVGLLSTGEYGTFNYNPGNLQGDVSMEVAYKLENGDSFTVYCAYEKGKIPEVVEEFLKSRGNPEK